MCSPLKLSQDMLGLAFVYQFWLEHRVFRYWDKECGVCVNVGGEKKTEGILVESIWIDRLSKTDQNLPCGERSGNLLTPWTEQSNREFFILACLSLGWGLLPYFGLRIILLFTGYLTCQWQNLEFFTSITVWAQSIGRQADRQTDNR